MGFNSGFKGLMVITSVCDNLHDLLFDMFESCNHV